MNAVCGTARTVLWEAAGYIPSLPDAYNSEIVFYLSKNVFNGTDTCVDSGTSARNLELFP